MSSALKDTKKADRASRAIEEFLSPTSGVHGVLFYGSENAPLLEKANTLAQGWLCLNLRNGKACGECRSCQSFARGTHVDMRTIMPQPPSRLINMEWIRKPDDLREDEADVSIQTFFRTLPLAGPRKIAIIQDADRMNERAQHALLKTLEEPHDYARLILTTTSLSILLPTVISRCVTISVETDLQRESPTESAKSIRSIAHQVGTANKIMALRLAEDFAEACAAIKDEDEQGARAAQAKGLVELAQALLASFPERPDRAQAAIEAHRRIVGNGQSGVVLDWLFAQITA